MRPKLGVIASGGCLPAEIVADCRETGRPVFVIALENQAEPDVISDVPGKWLRLGAAGAAIKALKREGVAEIVMAGSVRRPSLAELRPDLWTAGFLARTGVQALGDDGLLTALVNVLETEEGFTVVGVDDLLPRLLAGAGDLGAVSPDATEINNIGVGMAAARDLGARDIGQAVVVRGGETIAFENQQGTDAMLSRIAGLVKGEARNGVLVKVMKPGQERRVDLPTVGPDTVAAVERTGLAGIAVENGNALIVDREETIRRADAAGLFLTGVEPGPGIGRADG